MHNRGVLRARWQSIDRSKSGLLSVPAFRAILESSLGSLSDYEFRALLSSPSQVSLPAYIDYNVFFDNIDTGGVDRTVPLRKALAWLCTMPPGDLQALASQDGSIPDTALRTLLATGGHVLPDHLFASLLGHLGFMHTYPALAPAVYGKRSTVMPAILVERLGALRPMLQRSSSLDLSVLATAEPLSSSGRLAAVRFHPSVPAEKGEENENETSVDGVLKSGAGVHGGSSDGEAESRDSGKGDSVGNVGSSRKGASAIHVPTAGGEAVELDGAGKLQGESGAAGVGAGAHAGLEKEEEHAPRVWAPPSYQGVLSRSAPQGYHLSMQKKKFALAKSGPAVPPLDAQEEGRRIQKVLRMGQVGGLAEMLFDIMPPEPLNGATIETAVTNMLAQQYPAVLAAMLEHDYLRTGYLSRQDVRRVLERFTSPFSDIAFAALCRQAGIMRDGSVAYESFLRAFCPHAHALMAQSQRMLHASAVPLAPAPVPATGDLPRRYQGAMGKIHALVRAPVLQNLRNLKELFASADPTTTEEVAATAFPSILEQATGLRVAKADMDALCARWRGASPTNVNYARFLLYMASGAKKSAGE